MAAKLKKATGINAKLVPEGRGIFDVAFDSELVYSKFETGTFPDEADLVKLALKKYKDQGG